MDTKVSVETTGEKAPPIKTTTTTKPERLPWQRMALSLVGIAIISGMWRWETYHLYSLPEHSISAFTSVSNNAAYVIGAIVIFMVTGRLVYEWKNQTATTVVEQAQHIFSREERDEHVTIDETARNENLRADRPE